jgi:hypothetical protein
LTSPGIKDDAGFAAVFDSFDASNSSVLVPSAFTRQRLITFPSVDAVDTAGR